MTKKVYLYGDYEVEAIPAEVIMRRVEALKAHLDDLMAEHYLNRDMARCNKVLRSIDFWQDLDNDEKEMK